MVRRFFKKIKILQTFMLSNVKNVYFQAFFYKSFKNQKLDIYKCPFSKKILKFIFRFFTTFNIF
jgi:hypothetical protein